MVAINRLIAKPKSSGIYLCSTRLPSFAICSAPVDVVVVTTMGISGNCCLIDLISGVAAILSPTETACIQIGGLLLFSFGVIPKCSFQREPKEGLFARGLYKP